jgi:hypothetical protein
VVTLGSRLFPARRCASALSLPALLRGSCSASACPRVPFNFQRTCASIYIMAEVSHHRLTAFQVHERRGVPLAFAVPFIMAKVFHERRAADLSKARGARGASYERNEVDESGAG